MSAASCFVSFFPFSEVTFQKKKKTQNADHDYDEEECGMGIPMIIKGK